MINMHDKWLCKIFSKSHNLVIPLIKEEIIAKKQNKFLKVHS